MCKTATDFERQIHCLYHCCFVCFTGAPVFVHNCSSDPLTCERYSITGYPTLTAFRSLSWSTVESCSSSHSTYLRLDYHGVVFVSLHNLVAGLAL